MKRAFFLVLCSLAISLLILTGWRLYVVPMVADVRHPSQPIQPPPLSAQTSFVSLCSGLTLTADNARIGVANCLGRIRGFSDGHLLTVRLAANDPNAKSGIQLWCPDDGISDKQLLTAAINWTAANPDRFDRIVKQQGPVNAPTAVLIAALHETYPCQR